MKTSRCPKHKIPLITMKVTFCPACRGSATSNHKAETSRENGKKGGRPVGKKDSEPRKRREPAQT